MTRARAGLPVDERQEVHVAPDVLRAGLDATAQGGRVLLQRRVVVIDHERAEAPVADVLGCELVLGAALAIGQVGDSHRWNSLIFAGLPRVTKKWASTATRLQELAPSRMCGGCRGFIGPVPPPLWTCTA